MSGHASIGDPPWTRQQAVDAVNEFADIYRRRPIEVNSGGMQAPHMFATWFMLRQLKPRLIVESGVWKGQGTWILREACPSAELICIDPALDRIEHRVSGAIYSTVDFDNHDWSGIPEGSLAFFDDHQNAYRRAQQAAWAGFSHAIFEDNYPPGRGDFYPTFRRSVEGFGRITCRRVQLLW